MLYPDLMEDNGFVVNLFDVEVAKRDGSLRTTYYDYLRNYQDYPWWAYCILWVKNLFKSDDSQDSNGAGISEKSSYILSKADDEMAKAIRAKIGLSIDKKTGVITVSVEDQDPYVCKTIADSVSVHLQQFITDYRTNKARVDLEYYTKLMESSKAEYEDLRRKYNAFVDANNNVVLQSYRSRQADMENELNLKFQTYSTITTMYQQALGKVQERTPAFTVLKGAEMPLKPAKPKRMIFVAGMVVLAFFGTVFYIFKEELAKSMKMV